MFVLVAGTRIGVAGSHVPAVRQFACQFHLHPLGGGAGDGFIDILSGADVGGDVLRNVVLLDLEQGEAGVQLAFEISRLDAGFVAVTFNRLKGRTGHVLVNLRLVDLGVAGIHRVHIVQVIDHTGVRCDDAMFLVTGLGVGLGGAWIVGVVFVVLEGAQTAAEDERQVVGRTQACGQVKTVLALRAFVLAVFRELLFWQVPVPVKDAAWHQLEGAGVVSRTGLT